MAPRRKINSVLPTAHPASLDSALDLFSPQLQNDAYLDSSYVEHKPLNTLASSSHIDFQISGRGNDLYHDVRNMYIRGWLRLTDNAGAALPSGANDPKICLQNGGFNAMIESVSFSANETNLCPDSQNHSTAAFLMNVLAFDKASMENRLASELFILDDGVNPTGFNATNLGAAKRYELTKDGRTAEIWTKLLVDISTMSKLLPGSIDYHIRINLWRDPARYLFADAALTGTKTAKVQLLDLSLYVREVKLSPSLLMEHARLFAQSPAIINYKRISMREFVIPTGVTSFHIENIALGRLPAFMVVGLTTTAVSMLDNRFAFRHYDLKSIAAELPGKTMRYDQMVFDEKKETYSQAFNNLFIALGLHRSQEATLVNFDNFKAGLCLFLYDLSREQTGLQMAPVETHAGPLRISGEFKAASTSAVSCILMLVYDAAISINADRQVVLLD